MGSVGGLDSDVSSSTGGWRDIIVRVAPSAITTLQRSSLVHTTRFGDTSLAWIYTGGKFSMDLVVPIGSSAVVHSPASLEGRALRSVTEGGNIIWHSSTHGDPVPSFSHSVWMDDGTLKAAVGSGMFSFLAVYE